MEMAMAGLGVVCAVDGTAAAAAKPACPFTYTPAVRAVAEPEVDRVTSGHAADYRTDAPDVFTEDNGNVRLQFTYRGLDGDTIVVVLDPCTGKIVHSSDFPAFPQLGACPPGSNAPAGAWCVKPDDKKN
jgi:hypothetical protein